MPAFDLYDPNLRQSLAVAAVQAGGPFREFENPRQRSFLAVYAVTGNIRKAAEVAKVEITTPYSWRKNEENFRKAYDVARDTAIGLVEGEMFDRAMNGVERMKFYKGEAITDPRTGEPYIERIYPESSAQFLLKALPEYRDRVQLDGAVDVGADAGAASAAEMVARHRISSL